MARNEDGDPVPDQAPAPPGRSAMKRQARRTTELGARLIALPPQELRPLPLSDAARHAIEEARGITANVAARRQMLYVGKLLRGEDTDAIQAALDGGTAAVPLGMDGLLANVEAWRARIIAGGDPDIDAFLDSVGGADRQRLRQLARTARRGDPTSPKAKRAAKQLFAALRQAAEAAPPTGE